MSCDVVKNMAGWKEFEYCRSHKCGSKDCPKPKAEAPAPMFWGSGVGMVDYGKILEEQQKRYQELLKGIP